MGEGWSIRAGEVETVLRAVVAEAQTLTDAVNAIEGHVASAVTGSADSPVVAEAISVFFENRRTALQAMGTRVNAAVTGAKEATGWYLQGDEEMAATQQALAATVAGTGDFGAFTSVPA